MILKQYYLGCLAHASYLIVDELSRVAVVVDPQRDVGPYLEDARAHGAQIRHVFLTHFHADFLAGHIELRDLTGAKIHLGAKARAEFPFAAMGDGDRLALGNVTLEVMETPGHTPEGISIVVYDEVEAPGVPHAVLTGDTLFIGDVGRPDLMASIGITAEELAGQLYDSLHQKLLRLPDETLVYPAHGAGSMCGKNLSSETVSTIGAQRRQNYALQEMPRDEFIALVAANQPKAPGYFPYDAMRNREERGTLDQNLETALRPLGVADVLRRRNAGEVVLLDVREPEEFDARHVEGSLNVGLSGKFATWAGTMLAPKDEIVILAPDRDKAAEAALRLGRIGYDRVAGYVDGGVDAFAPHRELLRTTDRMDSSELQRALGGDRAPVLLDVRAPGEVESGRVAGAVCIPLGELAERVDELPRDRRIVTFCRSGYRSSVAASLLQARGFDVADHVGGVLDWQARGLPLEGVAGTCSAR